MDGGGGGDSVQLLQVQQRGVLLQQHLESVLYKGSSILASPFYAAHVAGTHADAMPPPLLPKKQPAAAEQQQWQEQDAEQQQDGDSMDVDKPAGAAAVAAAPADGSAAAAAAADAAQPMDVEQQQQQPSASPAAAAAPSTAAAASQDADPALIFSSLELVEQQIVAARLLLSRAYGIEVSLSPAGVRLGQYTAARLLGDASNPSAAAGRGSAAGAAGGSKRAAAAAGLGGLSRGGSGMLGARGLQREGSLAGSMKKRRVERSGIAGIGGVVEDDGVLSPSASLPARLMERMVSLLLRAASFGL
jgi:hypothetical protein